MRAGMPFKARKWVKSAKRFGGEGPQGFSVPRWAPVGAVQKAPGREEPPGAAAPGPGKSPGVADARFVRVEQRRQSGRDAAAARAMPRAIVATSGRTGPRSAMDPSDRCSGLMLPD